MSASLSASLDVPVGVPDRMEEVLVLLCRIDKKLDDVLRKFDEDESDEDELTDSDEDFVVQDVSPPKKRVKLTATPGQLKPFGYNRAKPLVRSSVGGLVTSPFKPPYLKKK